MTCESRTLLNSLLAIFMVLTGCGQQEPLIQPVPTPRNPNPGDQLTTRAFPQGTDSFTRSGPPRLAKIIPGLPDLTNTGSYSVTGIAFDGTYYYLAEGGSFNMSITRYDASGSLVDAKRFPPDFRGLHYVPALGKLVGRNWGGYNGGQFYEIDYLAGTAGLLTTYDVVPGDEQNQPAVDPDGLSYWVKSGDSVEQRRLSDGGLMRTFAVTSTTSFPAIGVSDCFVFVPNGSAANVYDKAGSFIETEPLSAPTRYYGFGTSANGNKIMYSITSLEARVEEATVLCVNDPQTKDDCQKDGWEQFGFRNQGQCVRFIETGKDSR